MTKIERNFASQQESASLATMLSSSSLIQPQQPWQPSYPLLHKCRSLSSLPHLTNCSRIWKWKSCGGKVSHVHGSIASCLDPSANYTEQTYMDTSVDSIKKVDLPRISHVNGTVVSSVASGAQPVGSTERVDWRGLSDDEFLRRGLALTSGGVSLSSWMSNEEFADFCWRRGEMLAKLGSEISPYYADVDLPAVLRDLRGTNKKGIKASQISKSVVAGKNRGKNRAARISSMARLRM